MGKMKYSWNTCLEHSTGRQSSISTSETRQLFLFNFIILMYNLIKQCNSGWKMTPFAAKLASNKLCFYHEIFFFTVIWKISDALCTLSPDWPFYVVILSDKWRRYLLISSPCSDSPLPTTECLQAAPSETDQFTPLQLSLQPFVLSSNWT